MPVLGEGLRRHYRTHLPGERLRYRAGGIAKQYVEGGRGIDTQIVVQCYSPAVVADAHTQPAGGRAQDGGVVAPL